MRVSTLIRQLESLNKNHPNATVSAVTQVRWFQDHQILGLKYEPDDGLVALHHRILAKGRSGFRVWELAKMLAGSAEADWAVVLDLGAAIHQVVAVTLFKEDQPQQSTGFLNDRGEPGRVWLNGDGIPQINTTVVLPLSLVQGIYQITCSDEVNLSEEQHQQILELRDLTYASLGLRP